MGPALNILNGHCIVLGKKFKLRFFYIYSINNAVSKTEKYWSFPPAD